MEENPPTIEQYVPPGKNTQVGEAEVAEADEVAVSPVYELRVKVPREMQGHLKKASQLAYKLGAVEKPDLVDLMNLFIGWGLSIQKARWLERIGYK